MELMVIETAGDGIAAGVLIGAIIYLLIELLNNLN